MGVGCDGGWGRDNKWRMSLMELIFLTFTTKVVFFIFKELGFHEKMFFKNFD